MNFDTEATALVSDAQLLERVTRLIAPGMRRQFWLIFLDGEQRQCPSMIPVDGIPDRPDAVDAERFAPVLDWLGAGESGESVVVVLERPGPRTLSDGDRAWIRTLRQSAAISELPVRAQLLVHDDGIRWLAPDDYL